MDLGCWVFGVGQALGLGVGLPTGLLVGFLGAGEQMVCFSWFGSSGFLCEECVCRGGGGYRYGLKMETLSPKPYYGFFIRDDHFYFAGVLQGMGLQSGLGFGGVRVSWMICQDCFLELGLWGWGLRVTWMIISGWFSWVGRRGGCMVRK